MGKSAGGVAGTSGMGGMGVILALLLAAWLAGCGRPEAPFRNTDISGADFGAEFPQALTDQRGQPRWLRDFRGQAVILFFGYTQCPDVCPTTLSRFAAVDKALGPDGKRLQVLFVTLDPERDTPARLAEYLAWFHPSFLGLTGSPADLEAVRREFHVYAARQEVGGALGYVLDHTAGAYLYDPAGRLRLFLKDDAPVAAIVADVEQLLAGK